MERHEAQFHVDDLVLCTDTTPIEHVGGPDDGVFLPMNRNGCRPGGMYVVVNDGEGRCIEKRWVTDDDLRRFTC